MLLDISKSLWKEAVVTHEIDRNGPVAVSGAKEPLSNQAGQRESEGNKELGNFPVCLSPQGSAVQQPQLLEVSRARGHHSLTLLPPPERLPHVALPLCTVSKLCLIC